MSTIETNGKAAAPHGDMVLESLREGIAREIRIHKALNNPIAIWRGGKVVWIAPEDIQIDEPAQNADNPA